MSVNIIENGKLKKVSGGASNTDDLADVALTGKYSDLIGAPTSLPANGGNSNTVGGKTPADLQNYNNLSNKPTIPSTFTDVWAAKGNANGIAVNGATKLVDENGNLMSAGGPYSPIFVTGGRFYSCEFDDCPTKDSGKLIRSGAVYAALQNAENTDEGSWTPLINNYSGNYIYTVGKYQKIGKMVFIRFTVVPTTNATSVNVSQINGLPFSGVIQDMPSALSGYITYKATNDNTIRTGHIGQENVIYQINASLSNNHGIHGSGWYESIE